MTVVFSAVPNNVTAMIIVGSLTGVSLKIEPVRKLLGFLLVEGLLTNIGGLLTLISSVPNIIVEKTAGIEFVDFFITASMWLWPHLLLWLGSKLFKIQTLKTEEKRISAQKLISGFDETEGIESPDFSFWSSHDLCVYWHRGYDLTITGY